MTNTINTITNVNAQAQEKAIRKTKRMHFEEILGKLTDKEDRDFIQAQIDLLDKKRANAKKTDKQVANEVYSTLMCDKLAEVGERMTIAELKAAIPEIADFSSQKVSAILNKEVNEEGTGKLAKVREKGVTYFMTNAQ